jgi:hypothetical protein
MENFLLQLTSNVIQALYQSNTASIITSSLGTLSAIITTYQEKNLERFLGKLAWEVSELQIRKIDRVYIYTDEFQEIILRILNTVSTTSSEVKRTAFAKGLINSAVNTDNARDRLLLVRILDQITEVEINILNVIVKEFQDTPVGTRLDTEDFIFEKLGYTFEESRIIIRGLMSLQLLEIIRNDDNIVLSDTERYSFYPTKLAFRLQSWCKFGS